jgi:BAAT / Acyl-CoA thioester hydrolase C terminal
MSLSKLLLLSLALGSIGITAALPAAETLPPLVDGKVPASLDELWSSFDPRREPLNVELCHETEVDGITCRVVRIDVGTFKGQVAKLALLYAFPNGASKLPGLLQIHGGGQSANLDGAIADAKRGYASISINWGGNRLNRGRIKETYTGPNTDWGALDATHPPQRQKTNHFAGTIGPDEFTLDPVLSPRNSNWFIVLVAARRALTFLEQQPEVDAARLGVYGHSMGGKLTTNLCAIDKRVKAAVPSCGGSGDVPKDQVDQVPGAIASTATALELATISDNAYISRITCPVLWLSPTNDFHAHLNHFAWTWRMVHEELVRLSMSPNCNHRHSDAHHLTQHLFFEQHLRQAFVIPGTPLITFSRSSTSGAPLVSVTADTAQPIRAVQIYYSTDPHCLTRFWRSAPTQGAGSTWSAECPIADTTQPFFAYADVSYDTPERYRAIAQPPGVGNTPVYTISSRVLVRSAQQVHTSSVRATDVTHERMIDEGLHGWQDWSRNGLDHAPLWTIDTRKLKDPKWRGPDGAALAIDLNPSSDCSLVVTIYANDWGAFPGRSGAYYAAFDLKGSPDYQTVRITLVDLKPVDERQTEPLTTWQTVTMLRLSPTGSVTIKDGSKTEIGKRGWANHATFTLRNVRWDGGTYSGAVVPPPELKSPADFERQFNDAIKQSLEQEKLERKSK